MTHYSNDPDEKAHPSRTAQSSGNSVWNWIRTKTTLTHYIFLGMLLGLLIGGVGGPAVVRPGQALSVMFLRSVKALISPLIFATLVYGIAGHGDDLQRVGRLFFKSLVYFEIVTTLALFLGLGAANLIQPGANLDAAMNSGSKLDESIQKNSQQLTVEKEIEKIFPQSFFQAAAENETLSLVVCAIAFSVAMLWVKREHRELMVRWCHSLSEIMFQVTWIVMLLAPLGIMGALMAVIGKNGFAVLKNLAILVATLYGTLVVFVLVVLVPILLICRIPIQEFTKTVFSPALLAFSTASSESALPMAMQRMHEFGVPQSIVAFVMPTGYSFNLDGTTLYLAIASRFAAQTAGIEQTLGTQLLMMISLMLVSKGVAAVPRASIVILASTCKAFNIPEDGILLILGVDAFMDMARTAINLVGNCLATVVVAQWEGQFRTNEKKDEELEKLERGEDTPNVQLIDE
jgi:proton glutamate symport protein